MGIDQFRGIQRTTEKSNNFNKKLNSGKDDNADQGKVLSLSAQVSAAKAKIQNSKQTSFSLTQDTQGLNFNKELSEKENIDGPKLKPQSPITNVDLFQEELQIAEDSLSNAKLDLSKRMDEAILSGSGEDIASLREEYQNINEARTLTQEQQKILKDPSFKDPDLVNKIQEKTQVVNSLTLDKTTPGRTELLDNAKQELALLKTQLFSQQ
jgi:hypothetical protein